MKTLSIGIGILAHNEEENISATLKSLFDQSVFLDPVIADSAQLSEIEIIVVPNGCTDNTTQVTKRELDSQISNCSENCAINLQVNGLVKVISTAGKSNAWNIYIHDLSGKKLDLIVMIDADIEFNQKETIKNSIASLLENEQAEVVVDTPLKSTYRKFNKSLFDKISLGVSKEYLDRKIGIAGSFYCSRADTLRKVWMPIGLPTEDGFLKAMIVTDMFRTRVDANKIIRADNASHFYAPETSIKGILKHELRSIIGTSINCYLTWDFLLFATDPKGPGAGMVLKNLIDNEPDWLQHFLKNTIANKGFWVLPRGMVTGRLRALKDKNPYRDYKEYIIVLLRFLLDLPILFMANQKIKKGGAIGYW